MTHYSSADVYSDANKAAGFARFLLDNGDTAVNITTTKGGREIKGPRIVDYKISPAYGHQTDYPYAEGSLKALRAALTAADKLEEEEPGDEGAEWEAWAQKAIDAGWEVKRHARAFVDMINNGFYTVKPDPEKIPQR